MMKIGEESFIKQYTEQIGASVKHFQERIETLTKKLKTSNNPNSVEGMIYSTQQRLYTYQTFLDHGFQYENIDTRVEIIEFLMKNGFTFTYSSDPQTPEFEIDGTHRHLRVRVNHRCIIILLDPHCAMQVFIGNKIYNINQRRIDFNKFSVPIKNIEHFIKRANDQKYDQELIINVLKQKTSDKKYINDTLFECGFNK